jgi:hypothetical protein
MRHVGNLEIALSYHGLGLCIIPIADRTKEPPRGIAWKAHHTRRPSNGSPLARRRSNDLLLMPAKDVGVIRVVYGKHQHDVALYTLNYMLFRTARLAD